MLCCPALVLANGDDIYGRKLPSSILVEAGADSSDTRDYFMALDLGLSGGQRIMFDAGQTQLDDETESDVALLRVGFASDPLNTFSFISAVEQRQLRDEFRIRSFNLGLAVSLHDWLITANGEFRRITLFPSERARRPDATDVYGEGWEIGVDYYGLGNWAFGVAYRQDDYDQDQPVFDTLNNGLSARFSQHTMNMVWGLNEQSGLVSVTYLFPAVYASVLYTVSESAVDNSNYETTSLRLGWDVTHAWTLEGEVGVGYSDDALEDDTTFYSVALQRRW